MIIVRFVPTWRAASEPITLRSNPDLAWFSNLNPLDGPEQRRAFRFTLQPDGRIWFGDASRVIHADVLRFGHPLMVGAGHFADATIHVQYLQYFAAQQVAILQAQKMLEQLVGWKRLWAQGISIKWEYGC